ncbi:MAG TPA: hypothetical protein DDY77_02570 [Clostridiales bacterium]|nr:hypothetical protein [Clostridiales bacterium]
MFFTLHRKEETTISVENNKKRSYTMKIDNTVFIVETEESEAAHETAEQKIKKLIEAGIDGLVDEERRRLNNQKATFEG